MRQYLKSYRVIMHTVGPLFVGSGREIGKREYIQLSPRQIGVLDIQKLYGEMYRRRKQAAFEDYLLGNSGMDLTGWLRHEKIRAEEMRPFVRYTLDCEELPRGENKRILQECVKDPYGNPYVPGSTLKGMFRTILLGEDMLKNPEKYQHVKEKLKSSTDRFSTDRRVNKNSYLRREAEEAEAILYRTLGNDQTNPSNAVNDVLQGLIVSDSEHLSVDKLALCRKIDRFANGKENSISILRECIKPGTEIRFTITVDTEICNVTKESLMEAVKNFITYYYARFANAFQGLDKPKVNYVLCGGGCGFASKTILYSMYGKKEGLEIARKIFEKTAPQEHRHYLDKEFGASPHTIKCTYYQNKLYQMGMCRLKIEEM